MLFQFVCPYPIYLDAQLAGSQWTATADATGDTDIAVTLNGAALATVTYGAASSAATVADMANPVITEVGDVLTFTAPGMADATLAGITGSVVGWY